MNDEKLKIMIIDDDRFISDMYSVKFKNSGMDVEAYLVAGDALKKLREGSSTPNVMLVDLVMPNIDGFEFIETCKKENLAKDAITVILSNQGQPSDIERAKGLNVQGYIVKATTIPSEVVEQVKEIYAKNKK